MIRGEERGLFGLRGYVPEPAAFYEKDSIACRKLLEDLAILDKSDTRILAFRGRRFERPLPETIWETQNDRLLLPEKGGCFLLLSGICQDADLALALYFRHTAKELSTILYALGHKDFVGLLKPARASQELFDLVAELLFYLDGLLDGTQHLPLRTLVLRAANFAGCRLKKAELPMQGLQLDPDEVSLFLTFLICFFLSVRAGGGSAEAETEEKETGLSIRISALPEEKNGQFFDDAPFLHCETFGCFKLARDGERQAVILPIPKPTRRLSSGGRTVYLSLLLECVDD